MMRRTLDIMVAFIVEQTRLEHATRMTSLYGVSRWGRWVR